MDKVIDACVITALKGELERGVGGVVFLEAEKVGYVLLEELGEESLREKLVNCLDDDGDKYFYIVHKHENVVHVSKLPRVTQEQMAALAQSVTTVQ